MKLAEIPEEVRVRAKYLILDGIACAFVGSHLPWSETATKAVLNMEPKGPCTIIGWGPDNKVSPTASALINSTFIQGFELDDVHSASPLHNNSLILPALFAAAQIPPNSDTKTIPSYSGTDFLRSYIIGCEVGPRIGLALHGPELLSRGWHSGTLMGPSSSAAACSSLLNLPPSQIEDALGIACTQAGGLMSAQFGSMAKRMQHGFASRNGLLATFLAAGGYTGIHTVYEQPYGGFLSCFSQGSPSTPQSLPDEIHSELGSRWELMRIRVKFHASMAALHGTIDALSNLRAAHPEKLNPNTHSNCLENIKHVTIRVSEAAYGHGGFILPVDEPITSTGAQMSIQYAAAAQLLDGQVLAAQFAASKLNRPELRKLMTKIEPVHDESLDASKETMWKTIVKVEFDDGAELEETMPLPHFVKPGLSNEEILEKWRLLCKGLEGMSSERMTKIEELVLGIDGDENEDGLRKLVSLLEENVGSALES